ncbi:hypothetical protein BC828DRAFT_375874 [Blastocladiella britannica]|nr:hypothetical protein BC828DRAFT_375874 [Blastocladiella britannica]
MTSTTTAPDCGHRFPPSPSPSDLACSAAASPAPSPLVSSVGKADDNGDVLLLLDSALPSSPTAPVSPSPSPTFGEQSSSGMDSFDATTLFMSAAAAAAAEGSVESPTDDDAHSIHFAASSPIAPAPQQPSVPARLVDPLQFSAADLYMLYLASFLNILVVDVAEDPTSPILVGAIRRRAVSSMVSDAVDVPEGTATSLNMWGWRLQQPAFPITPQSRVDLCLRVQADERMLNADLVIFTDQHGSSRGPAARLAQIMTADGVFEAKYLSGGMRSFAETYPGLCEMAGSPLPSRIEELRERQATLIQSVWYPHRTSHRDRPHAILPEFLYLGGQDAALPHHLRALGITHVIRLGYFDGLPTLPGVEYTTYALEDAEGEPIESVFHECVEIIDRARNLAVWRPQEVDDGTASAAISAMGSSFMSGLSFANGYSTGIQVASASVQTMGFTLTPPEPTQEQEASTLVAGSGRVLVHCHAGVSRSTTIVLLYMMRRLGMRLAEAFDVAFRARPIIRPNEGFGLKLQEEERQVFASAAIGGHGEPVPAACSMPLVWMCFDYSWYREYLEFLIRVEEMGLLDATLGSADTQLPAADEEVDLDGGSGVPNKLSVGEDVSLVDAMDMTSSTPQAPAALECATAAAADAEKHTAVMA